MPYNLRKRKVAEPVQEQEVRKRKVTEPAKQETRKRKATTEPAAKPAARKRKTVEPVKDEEEPPKSIVVAEPVKQEEEKEKKQEQEPEAPKRVADETVLKEEKAKKVKFEGNLFMFGVDGCGELGMGKIGITRKNPKPVPIDVPIKQIACGPCHTLALTESGKIYSFGCNDEGALGRVTDGDETLEATPTIIEMAGEVTKITTGDSHGAALTKENQVFIWGNFRDEHGSTGLLPECKGDKTFKPIQVMPDKKFQDIASGGNHMLLLDNDGIVYSFGVGAQGQLGRLSSEEAAKPLADHRDLFLTPMVVSMKNVDPSREFICDAIYAGEHSSFATNTDKKKNRLAGWGLNNRYQLGYKGQKGQLIQYYPRRSTFTCSTSMINVACGQHHTLFLTKTGRVYACGLNEYGRLGIGDGMKDKKEICPAMHLDNFDSPVTDISAKINTSFAVSSSGKLYAWGSNDGPHLGVDEESGDLMVPTEVEKLAANKVISVETGGTFTAVIVGY